MWGVRGGELQECSIAVEALLYGACYSVPRVEVYGDSTIRNARGSHDATSGLLFGELIDVGLNRHSVCGLKANSIVTCDIYERLVT